MPPTGVMVATNVQSVIACKSVLYLVLSDGDIHQVSIPSPYSASSAQAKAPQTPNSPYWPTTRIGGPGLQFATDGTELYGLSPATIKPQQIWQYVSGTHWNKIYSAPIGFETVELLAVPGSLYARNGSNVYLISNGTAKDITLGGFSHYIAGAQLFGFTERTVSSPGSGVKVYMGQGWSEVIPAPIPASGDRFAYLFFAGGASVGAVGSPSGNIYYYNLLTSTNLTIKPFAPVPDIGLRGNSYAFTSDGKLWGYNNDVGLFQYSFESTSWKLVSDWIPALSSGLIGNAYQLYGLGDVTLLCLTKGVP